tara:strand:- start:2140 stop:2358 length:219 start_codon:yes stop_codon:yes gene_type:complete
MKNNRKEILSKYEKLFINRPDISPYLAEERAYFKEKEEKAGIIHNKPLLWSNIQEGDCAHIERDWKLNGIKI